MYLICKANKKKAQLQMKSGFCAPTWARTRDPLINSQML